jgi:hypothetical protein
MSKVARSGVFIAYHFPEKRWLDRVQAALQPLVGDAPIVVWDDRKLLGGYAWRGELAEVLASSKVAIMIVSDPFLLSGFIHRAKLPSLLDRERENGLKICWVLAGYCLFSVAGLRAEEAANGINAALDGLSGTGRDAQIAEVARKVAQLLAAPEPVAAAAPAPEPAPAADHAVNPQTAEPPAAEEKPRAKRKRSSASKAQPQTLLPLVGEATPATPPPPTLTPLAPPPPQPHLEFPAPKPQTHLAPTASPFQKSPEPVAEPADPPNVEPRDVADVATAAKSAPASETKPAIALNPAPSSKPILVLPQVAPTAAPPVDDEPPPRRSESPMLPALDAVVEARQESIEKLRRLARWLKFAALAVVALSLPAAIWIGLTHFLLIFGFALFLASLALFLHARIALLGQRLVGLRYTRSGLADELLPNRQREPLLRRAAEILG